MNLAFVGGGSRCLYLLNFIEKHTFQIIAPKIVAVSDINPEAAGLLKAKAQGLFVTSDYNDFFKMDDLDLIIELTGNLDIYNDILGKKQKKCPGYCPYHGHPFLGNCAHCQKRAGNQLKAS